MADSSSSDAKVSKALAFYQEPGNLKKLCDFLRSRQGPALREAVLMDQRVYYIKGMFMQTHMRQRRNRLRIFNGKINCHYHESYD